MLSRYALCGSNVYLLSVLFEFTWKTRLPAFMVPVTLYVDTLGVVDTVVAEGAPVTLVSALVTLARFTGTEVGPFTRSLRLPTVETTARDVMSRQFPPIRGQSLGDGVGHSSRPHSLIVVLGL